MQIRQAQFEDVDVIAPLFDLYRQFYGRKPDLLGARRFLLERLEKRESVIFLASTPARAAGFVQLYPSFSSVSMLPLWILHDLFVDERARRQAIGRQLLLTAAEHARKTEAKGLTLKTAIDNLPAQALYESLGWKRNDKFYSYDLTLLKQS